MKQPESLKKGDIIGICAPSGGITKPEKIKELEEAEKHLKEMGYRIIETKSVRKEEKGRSNTAKKRAEEFMELLKNKEVKLIIFATGGDYLMEMLDYLDLEEIKKIEPKWMQGYSDITTLEFIFNTILEISSIYCDAIKSYAMRPLYKNLEDALKIASGEKVTQNSFTKCEKGEFYNINDVFGAELNAFGDGAKKHQQELNAFGDGAKKHQQELNVSEDEEPYQKPNEKSYNLTEKVEWKNINNEPKIEMQGRMIGGCLDCIKIFFGTKYDNIKNYINKYQKDGIIWYLECFEMNSPELTRILWQMKNAGYFDNINGIIFGRSLVFRKDYDTSFMEAVKQAIGDLNIPIIYDADIGHVAPQLAIVNGAIMKITSEAGKGKIEFSK